MAKAILVGRAGSPGVGAGRFLPIWPAAGTRHDGVHPPAGLADQRDALTQALDGASRELEALAATLSDRVGGEVSSIFEAQALFARDPGIVGPAFALVDEGIAADEAILRSTEEQAERLASVDDDYFRERAADVRDVGRRVAALVRGESPPELWRRDGNPAIVVAHDLDPSAVATLRPELVGGIALAGGAPTGHAAIVARALGIPLVLGLGTDLEELVADTEGAVDGSSGRLLIAPTEADLAELQRGAQTPVHALKEDARPNGIAILANVASAREAEAAATAGAEGIGLVRTELLFLGRRTPPATEEQRASYARIRAAMPGRHVTFRTLDVGGDKPAAWQPNGEANPALGVRGLRLGLRRPALLDDQFAALLEAAAGDELRLMLPMVSTRDEIDRARERLESVRSGLEARHRPLPTRIVLGVMIEVPSAAVMADALAASAEFFSIGTNDLVQYTLAADRTNPDLADLATPLQPAVLRLIAGVVRAARTHGRPVAVCGEAAADPSLIPLLIGLGVDELSVAPAAVRAVGAQVAELDLEACRVMADRALAASSVDEVRALLG